jgi:murein DD-endopeptidase MepM/ murein hydrolase activator NlpD
VRPHRGPHLRHAGVALLFAASLAALIPATSSAAAFGSRPLSTGSTGKDVRALQRSLTTLGYTAPTDGVYGKSTKQAVRKLERKQGWRVDGKVTRKDALRIAKLVSKTKTKAQTMFYLGAPTTPTATVTVSRPGTLKLNVIDENNGLGTFSFPINFTAAGSQTISWNGWTAAGIWAPDSVYRFRLDETGDTGATLTGQKAPFTMRRHAFPVPGAHSYGGAGSRFGAGRSDHVHQGQDMSASCGEPLMAAESGTVTTAAYQASGAGYYLVIQGAYTGTSHVYMHMQKPSWASEGTALYAGQQVGRVGTTGSSTGCHLHFERWSAPGWYEGGAAYDPLPELQYWDGYS